MMCDLALTNVGVFSAQEILEINLDCENFLALSRCQCKDFSNKMLISRIICTERELVQTILEMTVFYENYLRYRIYRTDGEPIGVKDDCNEPSNNRYFVSGAGEFAGLDEFLEYGVILIVLLGVTYSKRGNGLVEFVGTAHVVGNGDRIAGAGMSVRQ